jgi:hypothetical protein
MPKPFIAAVALVGTAALAAMLIAAPAPTLPDAGLTSGAEPAQNGIPMPLLRLDYAALVGVRLSGRVPDESEHEAILRRARNIYGADQVIDRISTGGVANPSWLNPSFLPDLRAASRASATLHDARLVIDGVVTSQGARDALNANVAGYAAQGVRVDSHIDIRSEP